MPVIGEPDARFLPMERVVGVTLGGVNKAYPFELISETCAVNDVVGGRPVVVLCGSPDTADALSAEAITDGRAIGTAIAMDPVVDDRVLTFAADGELFVDAETGSRWTMFGTAVAGPLTGTRFATVPHRNEFWFARVAFFPNGEVYEL